MPALPGAWPADEIGAFERQAAGDFRQQSLVPKHDTDIAKCSRKYFELRARRRPSGLRTGEMRHAIAIELADRMDEIGGGVIAPLGAVFDKMNDEVKLAARRPVDERVQRAR